VATLLVAGLLLPPGAARAADPLPTRPSSGPTASVPPTPAPPAPPGVPSPAPTTGPAPTSAPGPAQDVPTGSVAGSPAPAPTSSSALAAANEPPVAVDDARVRLVAGRSVVIDVLANDTDDGLGRPDTDTPHLEVATFSGLGARVTTDASHRTLRITARAEDAGRAFSVTYTATDGSLESEPATVPVVVAAPPVVRTVTLFAPRTLVALHTAVLHGTVRPVAPGPATVRVQRRVGARWTAFRSDRADARGAYAVRFRTNRPQRLTLRAVATWRNGRRAGSETVRRSVVARPDIRVSGPLTRLAVPYSYRAGCPVTPAGLRRISLNRFTYRHVVARGTLVVRAGAVPALVRVFRAAFRDRFPVHSMRPSDVFYARGRRTPTQSDVAAMNADNTSAFNCRPVTGNPFRISQHSYGNAIDINTVRNPYVVGSRVYPDFARTYLDRGRVRPGMILGDGVVAATMRRNGWPWGARWSHPDYQHFSANGG
jgi:hypothetical protein